MTLHVEQAKNRAENRGLRRVMVLTRATLQRRSRPERYDFFSGVADLSPRQAWYAFQTIKRWYERGRAGAAAELARTFVISSRVGRFEGFTIHRSEAAPR